MTVFIIIGSLLAAVAIYYGLNCFNDHCERKFSFKFFTIAMLFKVTIGGGFLVSGVSLYQQAVSSGGDVLNGILLMAIGIAILCYITYRNIVNTNLLYGVGVSTLQIPLFVFIGVTGFSVGLVVLTLYILAQARPTITIR